MQLPLVYFLHPLGRGQRQDSMEMRTKSKAEGRSPKTRLSVSLTTLLFRCATRILWIGEHIAYWSRYPSNYEHWRFSEGFYRGWDDAYTFFASTFRTNEGTSGFSLYLE